MSGSYIQTRLDEIAQHFEVMRGTCGRLRYDGSGQVVGRIGGYKNAFPETSQLKQTPAVLAKAIRRGKGKIYRLLVSEVQKQLRLQFFEHRSRIAHKAWQTRLQLLEWGATSSPREAALKAWETRRQRQTMEATDHV